MPLSARARADVWTRAPADVLPSVVDVGLVMRLGRGIGMDVLDLPAVGAGMDGTPFQALDRPPSVTTQHAPKIHDHLLPRYNREARRRALPAFGSRDQLPLLHCDPDRAPWQPAPSTSSAAVRARLCR